MKIDKVGDYRTSNGQRVMINTIFSGRAFGGLIDGYGFTGSSFWCTEDGSHPTQSGLQIVSEWVVPRQHDDYLRQQHEQTIEILRQRIDAAVSRAEQVFQSGGVLGISVVCVTDLEAVVEILRGNNPTKLEGSP